MDILNSNELIGSPARLTRKIDAVCRFVEATGKPAAIGQLCDAQALLTGEAGTFIAR